MKRIAALVLIWISAVGASVILPKHNPTQASRLETSTGTPVATRTATVALTPTPTPTPTSFHVADLALEIISTPEAVELGEEVQYTVRAYNSGPAAAFDAEIVVRRPFQLSLVSGKPPAICRSGRVCQDPRSILTSWYLTLYFEVTGFGYYELCASVWARSPIPGHFRDPDPSNNGDCVQNGLIAPFQSFLPLVHLARPPAIPTCTINLWMEYQGEPVPDVLPPDISEVDAVFEYTDCNDKLVRIQVDHTHRGNDPPQQFFDSGPMNVTGSGVKSVKIRGPFPSGRYHTVLAVWTEGGWEQVESVLWHVDDR